jgi:hypothetical protein
MEERVEARERANDASATAAGAQQLAQENHIAAIMQRGHRPTNPAEFEKLDEDLDRTRQIHNGAMLAHMTVFPQLGAELFRRGAQLLDREVAATLLREIFGNPFRPVTFDPTWRTSTAVAIARGMYESRDFSAMPILADALEDAGCDNADILTHCRDEKQVHVHGCWVVDLVLGKA